MCTVRFATVVLMIIAAPVFAASTVSYELQLGGDNHAASIHECTREAYTQGSAADSQAFYRSNPLNWAATIAASGSCCPQPPGHPDEYPIQGVANFVFNLELHQGTVDGPLAIDVTYYSTIHDGTGGSGLECKNAPACQYIDKRASGGYTIPDPTPFCAGSAFAYVFDIGGIGWGPGTVLEAYSGGEYTGPYMEVGMYPTVDVGNTSGDGQLLGVGAGYGQWNRDGYATRTTKGVGIPTANGGLGILPVVEGQIDVSRLPVGTYVLVLTPGTGHNVLRGDVELVTNPAPNPQVQAFAVPANQTAGDTITFVLTPALALVSVEAVRTHGTAEIGVPFFPNTNAVECRTGSVSKVVATFNQTVYCWGGSCDPDDVSFLAVNDNNSSVSSVSVNGSVVTVNLTGQDKDPDQLYFGFQGIQDSLGNVVDEDDYACIRVISGDVNSSGTTDQLDLVAVRDKIGQPVTSSNFRNDVNANGVINQLDLVAVRGKLGQTIGNCQ